MSRTVFRTCTLCEANCGLRFDVLGDRILSVRPDAEDPFSQGYVCPKGIAIAAVHDDPDRLRSPMRRVGPDRFEPIGWEEALDLASEGLRRVRDAGGRDAVAVYWGNPIIHNHGALVVRSGVNRALRTRNVFGAGSQDVSPRFAASWYLYGRSLALPVPDIDRTDYFLCVGANPVVSNGSVMTAPDMRGRIRRLRARGGRIVVVDPRRSETAEEADEHVAIRPGTDAAFLLGLAALVLARRGADAVAKDVPVHGLEEIVPRLRTIDPDVVARFTGVPREISERLAREFLERPTSVAYSRIGVCNARYGTLATYATDLLNLVAGRLGRTGGAMFPTPAIDVSRIVKLTRDDGQGRWRTRVRGLPETLGEVPSAALAEEMETPGDGQVRALLTFAGNPVLSAPNGRRIAAALSRLEFMVSIDLYVNETTRHADLILPPAWSLAEEHVDLFFPLMSVRNTARWSPPVVEPGSGERHDWQILYALATRLGGGPTGMRVADLAIRAGEKLGYRWSPRPTVDFLLRTGAYGDRYLPWRKGLSLRRLEGEPHGLDLGPLEEGVVHRLGHRDRRVHVSAPEILRAWDALDGALASTATAPDGLLLIGRRELRSNNSWMHNVAALTSGAERCLLFLHPKDAATHGVGDGDTVVMESRVHRGEVRVRVTEEISPGVVSLPHGWGHAAAAPFQRVAARTPGVSMNDWTDEAEVEGVVGQSILNGVPVRITAAA